MAYYNSHKPEKNRPGTGERKKIQDNSDTPDNTKKNRWVFLHKKHINLIKNQPHINADTKLKIIQNVNTITK
jgi:hypothetical protein